MQELVPGPKLTSEQDQALLERRRRAGAWLKSLRQDADLSTQDIASATGNVSDFITSIERGDDRLPTTIWANYAEALGVLDKQEFGKALLQLYDSTLFTLLYGNPDLLTDDDWTRRTGTRKASSGDIERLRKAAGAWLREQRELAGLTQQQLVDAVGIGERAFVTLVESGRSRLPRERYPQYARALKMDLKKFTMQITVFYDPEIFTMLFGELDN